MSHTKVSLRDRNALRKDIVYWPLETETSLQKKNLCRRLKVHGNPKAVRKTRRSWAFFKCLEMEKKTLQGMSISTLLKVY